MPQLTYSTQSLEIFPEDWSHWCWNSEERKL